ncbi:MAG: division/cell wall cluster transcriptional repressor MraZ [bacterium]
MFRGRFENTIDSKGRISVPSKFREVLSAHYDERLIITNFDGCLWAYPVKEWQAIEEKVSSLPQFKAEVRALQRVFISAASECPLDKQGRILIPPSLREYAGIEREVVFVGMVKRIEIWGKGQWLKEFDQSHAKISDSMEVLANLGI